MMQRLALCLALLALPSCGEFPRDPEGTLVRVRAERSFSVGVAGGGLDPAAGALIKRIATVTGAVPRIERGEADPLLTRVENGELDLVIGRFSATTPWSRLVTFSPPLQVQAEKGAEIHLGAAMRNGENAWIGLVEREARDLGAGL
jgi:ABC-type amino acid transport substrate-binding protein